MTAVTYKFKGSAFQNIESMDGSTYSADSTGVFTGVSGTDVSSFLAAGCQFLPGTAGKDNLVATAAPGVTNDVTENYDVGSVWLNTLTGAFYICKDATDGAAVWGLSGTALTVTQVSLLSFKNQDGSVLAAAASSGKFGIGSTVGTSLNLAGEAAQNNTKTDNAMAEFIVPQNYTAGANLTVTINAKLAGTGTAGTKTLDLQAFEVSTAGAAGADICATAVQTLTTSNADYAFTITGTDLVAGDKIQLNITGVAQETGNVNPVNVQVNSVKIA